MATTELRRRRAIVTGAVVAAVVGLSIALTTQAHKGLPWQDETIVHAEFSDVSGLRVGDEVRIGRVRVGTVEEIELVHGQPQVTMLVSEQRTLYRNATAEATVASVASRSLLGQRYVNLYPGSPPAEPLGPDDVISGERTTDARDLSTLLDDVFDKPTRQATGSTLREVGGGLAGHARDFNDALGAAPTMLPQMGTIANALAANDGADMTAMLTTADRLAGRFADRQQHIAHLLRQLTTTMNAVGVDQGDALAATLQRSPAALRAARAGLESLQAPLSHLEAGMQTARPGLEALGEATPDLRGTLREAKRPLDKMPPVNRQAQRAVSDLTDVVKDARPLAPRAAAALEDSHTFLKTLLPYAPEVTSWFTKWTAALSHRNENGHYLRLSLLFSEESAAGQGGLKSPLVDRNPYPAPGEAAQDRTTLSPGGDG